MPTQQEELRGHQCSPQELGRGTAVENSEVSTLDVTAEASTQSSLLAGCKAQQSTALWVLLWAPAQAEALCSELMFERSQCTTPAEHTAEGTFHVSQTGRTNGQHSNKPVR